jgi:hypothetical protein
MVKSVKSVVPYPPTHPFLPRTAKEARIREGIRMENH